MQRYLSLAFAILTGLTVFVCAQDAATPGVQLPLPAGMGDNTGNANAVQPLLPQPPMSAKAAPQPAPTQPAANAQNPVPAAGSVRLKDIATLEGERYNILTGFGLVTGLAGTGGTGPITRQFALNLLDRFGYRADPILRAAIADDARQKTNNLAVVMVTCKMPAFARAGSNVDVLVSVWDDASSLQGGQLVMTALEGIDGQVHAMASGPISIGGFSFSGAAATVSKNHANTGRVPNGAVIEEPVGTHIGANGVIRFLLNSPDYETARRAADVINKSHHRIARALDPGTVEVIIPAKHYGEMAKFIGELGGLRLQPDNVARVVINERTGTVIVGESVRLSPVAITHANLSVVTGESAAVSQPNAFANGETVVVPQTNIDVIEEEKAISVLNRTATVGDLANALNVLGVTPRDLSSIFQQLKESGALHAQLEFN